MLCRFTLLSLIFLLFGFLVCDPCESLTFDKKKKKAKKTKRSSSADDDDNDDETYLPNIDHVTVLKIGGSSITNKRQRETLNQTNIQWFAQTLAAVISDDYKAESFRHCNSTTTTADTSAGADGSSSSSGSIPNDTCGGGGNGDNVEETKRAFIVIHGAGSFGHHHAKEYGLTGKTDRLMGQFDPVEEEVEVSLQRFQMEGLAKTRLSVQTLNRILVAALIEAGINAVGISPCFAAPWMRADGSSVAAASELRMVVESALLAGLVPVLHGDACLYGKNSAGILSGDKLFQILGLVPWVDRGVFLTDVDGVYSADPKEDDDAMLMPKIGVHAETGALKIGVASGKKNNHNDDDKDQEDNGNNNHFKAIHSKRTAGPDVTGGFHTKLVAAFFVAQSGTNVTIARTGSKSAERILQGTYYEKHSTFIYQVKEEDYNGDGTDKKK